MLLKMAEQAEVCLREMKTGSHKMVLETADAGLETSKCLALAKDKVKIRECSDSSRELISWILRIFPLDASKKTIMA